MGVITEIYSLDRAVNHRNFPKDMMEKYVKEHPEYRNKVIVVKHILNNSPAEKLLLPGDILWQVNGKDIAANLFLLDEAMNLAESDKISLTIYRNGEKKDIEIGLYNVMNHQVKKLLDFAGGIIFEADDFTSAKYGVALGSVTMVNVQKGSSLSTIPAFVRYGNDVSYRLVITELDKRTITNLASLLDILPEVIKKKFITINFKNHQPYIEHYNGILQSGHNFLTTDITLDTLDTKPRMMSFDDKIGEWVLEEINKK